jgi:hypothetical protein
MKKVKQLLPKDGSGCEQKNTSQVGKILKKKRTGPPPTVKGVDYYTPSAMRWRGMKRGEV